MRANDLSRRIPALLTMTSNNITTEEYACVCMCVCACVCVHVCVCTSLCLSYWFYVTFSMRAWVGLLLPYSDYVASHSNHTPRAAVPFLSINSFSRTKDGGMIVSIHGDHWCKLGRTPFLAPNPPMGLADYQHVCG